MNWAMHLESISAGWVINDLATTSFAELLIQTARTNGQHRGFTDCERRTVANCLSMLLFFNHHRSPDSAKIKPKMLYASSKDGLRKSLTGVGAEIQGTDYDEVAFDTVLDRIRR